MRGEQGIGKNTFADAIGALVEPHYLSVNNLEQLTGRFNGHLSDKILVYANEAIWGGNKQHEGALKAMITDKHLPYEFKQKDIVWMGNYKRLIVGSNEEWAVPRGADDRRFLVLDVSDVHKGDEAYWTELHRRLDSGMLEAVLHDLQSEDISGFNPRKLPVTAAGIDMKLKSATSVERWLYEFLDQGYRQEASHRNALELRPEGQYVDKRKIYDQYWDYCFRVERGKQEPESSFWKKIRKILEGLPERRSTSQTDEWIREGATPRQVTSAGERIREVQFPALPIARKAMERYFRQPIDWSPASTEALPKHA